METDCYKNYLVKLLTAATEALLVSLIAEENT
jgi:hypothetical protein